MALVAAMRLGEAAWLGVLRAASGELFGSPLSVIAASGDDLSDATARRAAPGDGVASMLLRVLTASQDGPNANASGVGDTGFAITGLGQTTGDMGQAERPMLVDQTHESVVVGERVVVKWAVRAEATPASTLVAHLAEARFDQMARPWGFVTWDASADETVLLASAVQFLEGASDGWSWTVGDAGDYAAGQTGLNNATVPLVSVGELVADLHIAMATSTSVISAPRLEATASDVVSWQDLARQLLAEAVDEVDGAEGERLRDAAPRIEAAVDALRHVRGTPIIPVHGDLHVGQILRWRDGYAVGDFDGNPVLPVSARLAPQPAARDVAGMLQSLDHVGRVVNRRVDGASPSRTEQWIEAAQSTFLDAYLSRLSQRGHAELFDQRLVVPFRFEQECREYLYAVRHLPRWRYVPDQALTALLSTVD
ncbi:MAG: aminoglycoside phosphotransferase [Actinomycetes bacterium]